MKKLFLIIIGAILLIVFTNGRKVSFASNNYNTKNKCKIEHNINSSNISPAVVVTNNTNLGAELLMRVAPDQSSPIGSFYPGPYASQNVDLSAKGTKKFNFYNSSHATKKCKIIDNYGNIHYPQDTSGYYTTFNFYWDGNSTYYISIEDDN